MSEIFRKKVLDSKTSDAQFHGSPTSRMPSSWSYISALLVAFVIVAAVFSTISTIPRTERVRGMLQYEAADVVVFPVSDGVVYSCDVSNGENVVQGQILATIRAEQFLQRGSPLYERELENINQERDLVRDRKQAARDKLADDLKAIELELSKYRNLIADNERSLQLLRIRHETAQERASDAETFFEEGLIPKTDLYELRERKLVIEQSIIQVETDLGSFNSDVEALMVQQSRMKAATREELVSFDQQLNQISANKLRIQSDSGYSLRAPKSGIITNSTCKIGNTASPNASIMSIVPSDSYLIAELFVPSTSITFIEPGQLVKLRYDALPHQKYGTYSGEISEVAATIFPQSNLDQSQQASSSLYRVRVALDQQQIVFQDSRIELRPGMEFSAQIVLEERKVIELVFAAFGV